MIDIQAIFDIYHIPYVTDVSRGWINTACPFCGDEKFHLGFNPVGEYAHCWKCGGHSLKNGLKAVLNVDTYTVNELLHKYSSRVLVFNKMNNKAALQQSITLPGGPLQEMHKKYLRHRNFDPDYLEMKYKLRGTDYTGEWKFRIIIPIIYNNVVVSFQGRAIKSSMLRYKTLSVEQSLMNPKSVLYNLDNCTQDRVVVVEGPFDVMRLGDNVCGTLGTSMTREQILLLKDRFKEVLFLFDSEKEAQQRAKKQAEQVASYGIEAYVVDMEWSHDPGALTPEEVSIVKRALHL